MVLSNASMDSIVHAQLADFIVVIVTRLYSGDSDAVLFTIVHVHIADFVVVIVTLISMGPFDLPGTRERERFSF